MSESVKKSGAETAWRASLGACVRPQGVSFRVWAPEAGVVEVTGPRARTPVRLRRARGGYHEGLVPEFAAGDLYRYLVDGRGPFPDPASRGQPEGVRGPSHVVDPAAFRWTDAAWACPPLEELTLYELHVGTFTPRGTFAAAAEKLRTLADLGVGAVELMPVAEFPGRRNWGYDGVFPFAPCRAYGTPDDLRAFVDAAHAAGLAVLLDVVYNHLGPDGNVLGEFSRAYFRADRPGPWGAGLNWDGPDSGPVRAYFIENARYWVQEFHVDGLRVDATHAIDDRGPLHFCAELAGAVRAASPGRRVLLIAEDDRNRAEIVRPPAEGGWGFDAVWSGDFHHQLRRMLAGDKDGYYADFEDRPEDLAAILRRGWLYAGQYAPYFKAPRGTPTDGVDPARFVFFLQNHDQVGNRAFGERLNRRIDAAAWRAASALLLCLPQTPLLFMGQEWDAATPFLYFTDHEPELGRAVTAGRREEFRAFAAFADPAARARIPDPQRAATFERSRLSWEEAGEDGHAGVRRLYQALLALRRGLPRAGFRVLASDKGSVAFLRGDRLVLVQLRFAGRFDLSQLGLLDAVRWRSVLTTEEERFVADARPVACRLDGPQPDVAFARPGAAVLRSLPPP